MFMMIFEIVRCVVVNVVFVLILLVLVVLICLVSFFVCCSSGGCFLGDVLFMFLLVVFCLVCNELVVEIMVWWVVLVVSRVFISVGFLLWLSCEWCIVLGFL